MADDDYRDPIEDDPAPLSDEEVKARRKRSIAIALGIAAFIAIVYLTTIFRYAANNAAG